MYDLSVLTTESRNDYTMNLDCMSAEEIVKIMNSEDKKIPAAIEPALPQIARVAELAAQAITKGFRIIYVGSGTSGRLGVLDAVECMPTFGVSSEQVTAVMAGGAKAFQTAIEGAEDNEKSGREDMRALKLKEGDVVIGVAASGRTPYVCAAIEYANRIGCHTASLSCNAKTLLSGLAEIPIEVIVGPEVLTGSTRLKAGTAQKMVLNMISTTAMVLCGKVYENLMVDVVQTNEKLHARARNIVVQATGVGEELADKILKEAGGNTKIAVTMILAGINYGQARKLLKDNAGHVRQAVAEGRL